MDKSLSESQLQRLGKALHLGAGQASRAMATWLSVPSVVTFDSIDQLPISDAADVLGGAEQTLCFCSMEMTGCFTGQIILAFDDSSGLSLSDLLLDHPIGSATGWGEVETSAALEKVFWVNSSTPPRTSGSPAASQWPRGATGRA